MDRRRFLRRAGEVSASFLFGGIVCGCGPDSFVQNFDLAPEPVGPPNLGGRSYDYDLCYVACYGQSLSLGNLSVPPLSKRQRYDSVMFNGGVVAQADSNDPDRVYARLSYLSEQVRNSAFVASHLGVDPVGETPVSGIFEAIKELMYSQDNAGPNNLQYQLLGSAPGHGAYSIYLLMRGTEAYTRLITEVIRGKTLATAANKSFGVPCIAWMQGEADACCTTQANYAGPLTLLFNNLNEDIKAITGQKKDIFFLTYQTASHDAFNVACAQLQVSQQMPNVRVAAPCYPFAKVSDELHLTAVGSKSQGAYFGAAYKRVVINGENWLPLTPAAVSAQDNVITVKLNIPAGPVVADTNYTTSTLPIKEAFGFSLLDAAGSLVNITGKVAINSASQVVITAPVPIAPGFELRYGDAEKGYTGGNIRDSQGDTYVFNGGGLNLAMHNWLTVFRHFF